jgi:aldehyde dehydrogenase (NAD+)
MAAAAKHLASVTLELGGKSPVVIDQTADLEQQAYRLAWAKCLNKGQTCIAPDYVLLHESLKDAFVDAYRKALKKLYPGDELQSSADYCRIVNLRHTQRLRNLYEDAIAKGAREAIGNAWNENERFVPPTLLTEVHTGMDIMQEEIFGPLLPVMTYRDPADAIRLIQSQPKPLTIYICSKDKAFTEQLLRQTSSGSAVVNDFMLSFASPELGFGGVNNSGIGQYMGYEGFLAFSNQKPVLKRRFLDLSIVYPPYTPRVEKLLQFIGRWIA